MSLFQYYPDKITLEMYFGTNDHEEIIKKYVELLNEKEELENKLEKLIVKIIKIQDVLNEG